MVMSIPYYIFHKIKRPADLSIVERLGGFLCCKGKAFIWIVQGFWKKNAEMEVVFNECPRTEVPRLLVQYVKRKGSLVRSSEDQNQTPHKVERTDIAQ